MCVSRIDSGVCMCVLMKGEGNKKMYSPCYFVCVILELDTYVRQLLSTEAVEREWID